MKPRPPENLGDDEWDSLAEEIEASEHLEPGPPHGKRKDTNKGKKYKRRVPVTVEGNWVPMFEKDTWQLLLSAKSWVVIGVFRSLATRAKSKGHCDKVNQEEVAAENGCATSAVNKAYRTLENKLKLVTQTTKGHIGKFSAFDVRGYRRSAKGQTPASEPSTFE